MMLLTLTQTSTSPKESRYNMSPKPERINTTTETNNLTEQQRGLLVNKLVPYVDETYQRLSKNLEPYAILAGLLGVLKVQHPKNQGDGFEGLILEPEEVSHLRKMIGLET